jgi:hypothetical protein
MAEQPIASQDWHTRAIVRFLETVTVGSPESWRGHTYHKGEEVEMIQWGNKGRPIDRGRWWSSYDIDGAFIVKSDKTEIVKILDEVAPVESEQSNGQ